MMEPRFDATVSQCSSRRSDQREILSVPYHTHVGRCFLKKKGSFIVSWIITKEIEY